MSSELIDRLKRMSASVYLAVDSEGVARDISATILEAANRIEELEVEAGAIRERYCAWSQDHNGAYGQRPVV